MPKLTRLLPCLLLFCLIRPGHAQVTLEVAVQSPAGSGTQTFHVASQQLRMDIQLGLTRSSILYDATTDSLTLIDHQEQAYVRINPEQAARLAQTVPGQSADRELVDTGRVKALNERVACRVYEVYSEGRLAREICLANYRSLGLNPDEYRVFSSLLAALERMAGDTTGKTDRLAGQLPMRTVDYDSAGQAEVTALRSVKRGASGVSFQVPAGYVEESPF